MTESDETSTTMHATIKMTVVMITCSDRDASYIDMASQEVAVISVFLFFLGTSQGVRFSKLSVLMSSTLVWWWCTSTSPQSMETEST